MSDLYFAFDRNGGAIGDGYSDSTDAAKALQRHDAHGCVVRKGVVLRWGTDSTPTQRRALEATLILAGIVTPKATPTPDVTPTPVANIPTPSPTPSPTLAPVVAAQAPVSIATADAASSDPLFVALMAKYGTRHHVSLALKSKNIAYSWRDNRVPANRRAQVEALLAGKTIEQIRPPKSVVAKASKRAQQPTPQPRALINASPPPPVAASTPAPVSAPDAMTIPRAEWERITARFAELESRATEPVAQRENEAPTGLKDDQGKRDWTLVPWDGLACVVEVLEFGARKYARDNWRVVPSSTTRYERALARHVIAHLAGEQTDVESGLSHLAHAACCVLFLLAHREAP